jgi:hypothetical protein
MVSVANPVVATVAGIVLLGEGFRYGTTGALLALAASALIIRGVAGLASVTAAAPPSAASDAVVVPGPSAAPTGVLVTAGLR